MRTIATFLLFLVFQGILSAQVIMPKFQQSTLINEFKDKGETSNIRLYNDGNNIYYYRVFFKGEGEKLKLLRQNIWFSERKGDNWSRTDRLFTEETYPGENILIGSSEDGKRIYVFQNLFIDGDSLERKIGYKDFSEDDGWSDFTEIQIPGINIEERFYFFYMNPTEDVLMISMTTEENPNQEDLFVCVKEDGKWKAPINLGASINTNRGETSPFIDSDKKTLFFASEGHGGNGGTDIYVSYRLDDSWQNWTIPVNLGDEINTKDYEENFVHAGNGEYYFTSNYNDDYTNIYYTTSDALVSVSQSKAKLMKDKKPLSEISIHVLDPNGMQIDDQITDANGFINHIRLDKQHIYQYVIIDDSPKLEGSKFYLLNEQNKCIYRLVGNKNNKLVDDLAYPTTERVKVKIEGLANKDVDVIDENGYIVQSVSSDKSGNISFRRSNTDAFLVLSYNGGGRITSAKSIDFAKREKDLMKVTKGNTIYFNQYKDEKVAILEEKSKEEKPYQEETTSPIETNNNTSKKETIYFDFNQLETNYQETKKVKIFAKNIVTSKPSKVRVIGHTDANGSEEINNKVALERANSIKSLLEKAGVKSEIIVTISKGEKEPANKMIDAKNRRVVIEY